MRGIAVQKSRGNNAAHWGVIDDPTVQEVAATVAKGLADMNQGILEAEDLTQEALILVAATPSLAERAIVREYGALYNELRMDMLNKFITPLMRTGEMEQRKYKTVSIGGEDDEEYEPLPSLDFNDGDGAYTSDAVKVLLPAVKWASRCDCCALGSLPTCAWDESYAYGLPDRDDAPDRDMPKAAANKSRSNNHWAYIADIKTGWSKTPLTRLERRALLMGYGLGYTHEEIAQVEGVARRTITERIDIAIKKIVARLNGAGIEEDN